MANCVVSIKVAQETRDIWKANARSQGMSFNSWAISALNDQVALDGALERDVEAKRQERRQIVSKTSGGKCSTPKGKYCYLHDTRHV